MSGTESDVDWGRVLAEATAIALRCMSEQDAEDVVSAGAEAVITGNAPFVPTEKQPSLARHVLGVGYNILRNERRKITRRKRPAFVAEAAEQTLDPPSPEELVEERERKGQLVAELSLACAKDPNEQRVLEAELTGVLGLAAQVEHLSMSEREVRTARQGIRRKLEAIVKRQAKEGREAAS